MDFNTLQLLIGAGVLIGFVAVLFFSLLSANKALKIKTSIADKVPSLESDLESSTSKTIQLTDELLSTQEKLTYYQGIQDIEAEIINLEHTAGQAKSKIEDLRSQYKEKRQLFDKLVIEAAIYDETISFGEVGHYIPHFNYNTSEEYKAKLLQVRDNQKKLIKSESAMVIFEPMTLNGSKSKGMAMQKRLFKMSLRAFNNECDAAISSTRWNNMETLEKRIRKSFEMLNKYNSSTNVGISSGYQELKITELHLSIEQKIKIQEEKEEQSAIKQQMREESALEREAELAAKEEDKYQRLLSKANKEAENTVGAKLEEVNDKIVLLKKELEEAHSKNERAKSMAEQTKRGHVYVISNIGSFGENVYKIGMTRRLEPLDRVKELGDASVPFLFDVHAMIYSEDAPALESALHREFTDERVNLVNFRKEFFNVSLEEIEEKAHELANDAEFVRTAEANHYRESKAIRLERESLKTTETVLESIPVSI